MTNFKSLTLAALTAASVIAAPAMAQTMTYDRTAPAARNNPNAPLGGESAPAARGWAAGPPAMEAGAEERRRKWQR